MPAVCTARRGMSVRPPPPPTPAPFVLDGDGFQQCGGATVVEVVEVLRRTDLGKVHADLPMDG